MNLAAQIKGPLGQKVGKAVRKARKQIPRVSRKRKEYLASPERAEGLLHMGKVAQFRCLVCGSWPVEVHHEGKPKCDKCVLPLCPRHHRREFGPGAYHYSPKAFYAAHGDRKFLLSVVKDMMASQ